MKEMAVGVLKTEGVTSYVVAAGCAAAFRTAEIRKQRSLQGLFFSRRVS